MKTVTYYALAGVGRLLAARGDTEGGVLLLEHNAAIEGNPYQALIRTFLDELVERLDEPAASTVRENAAELTLDQAIELARSALAA